MSQSEEKLPMSGDDSPGKLTARKTTVSALPLADQLPAVSTTKKKKKPSVSFGKKQIFYFPRQQGFSSVPKVGGCTLGMAREHVAFEEESLSDGGSSSDASKGVCKGFYCREVPPHKRREILQAAGVAKIDSGESDECKEIRKSRKACQCKCDRCIPATCSCYLAGLECFVDEQEFSCSCLSNTCFNPMGRNELDEDVLDEHIKATLQRVKMDRETNNDNAIVEEVKDEHLTNHAEKLCGQNTGTSKGNGSSCISASVDQNNEFRSFGELSTVPKATSTTPWLQDATSELIGTPSVVAPSAAAAVGEALDGIFSTENITMTPKSVSMETSTKISTESDAKHAPTTMSAKCFGNN